MDLGFVESGFEISAAFDSSRIAVENYNANVSDCAKVYDLSKSSISFELTPDVVVAGSPCQGFSTIGQRSLNDPRNLLFYKAAEIATNIEPQVIVLENVPGILQGEHKKYLDYAVRLFKRSGYFVQVRTISALDVGLPQRRTRVFLIATKSRARITFQKNKPVPLSKKLSGVEDLQNHEPKILPPKSVDYLIANAIKPGQKLCDVRGGSESVHSWEIPDVYGYVSEAQKEILVAVMRLRRRIRLRTFGDGDPVCIHDISKHVNFDPSNEVDSLIDLGYLVRVNERIDLSRRFNGKFRRLRLDGISNTVDTHYWNPRYFLHPRSNRGMSAREAARIQGFPDHFGFRGSIKEQFK